MDGNSIFSRIMSFVVPPAPPSPAPMQKGQSVSDFPGYQKPKSPPPSIDVAGLNRILAGAGQAAGKAVNTIGGAITGALRPSVKPNNVAPKMTTQQAVQQMQKNGWSVASPSPSPAAQIMAMMNQPKPSASPMPMPQGPQGQVDPSQFRFQMGQKSYPQAQQQLTRLFGDAPLAKYIPLFVAAGEKYGVDPRILALIAMNESSGGRNYPVETNNPFGYTPQNPNLPNGGNAAQRLAYAGFNDIPHAIDALTYRFVRPGTPQGYAQFRQEPTINNLQAAYNANPAEQGLYLKNLAHFLPVVQ